MIKCQWKDCGKKYENKEKDQLIKEVHTYESGRTKNNYYCPECHPKHLKHKKFIENEMREKDILNETVKRIYGIPEHLQLTTRWWNIVNDLRNGTNRYQKFWKKKYKQGIPYSVLAEAYVMSKPSIEWARMAKNFKTMEQETLYGLSIAGNKVVDAHKKIQSTKQNEKRNKAMEKSQIQSMIDDGREVKYKKQNTNDDYSYLLGDD